MLNMDFQRLFGFFLLTKFSGAKLCIFIYRFMFVAHAVSFYSILLHRPESGQTKGTFQGLSIPLSAPDNSSGSGSCCKAGTGYCYKFVEVLPACFLQGLLSYSAADHVLYVALFIGQEVLPFWVWTHDAFSVNNLEEPIKQHAAGWGGVLLSEACSAAASSAITSPLSGGSGNTCVVS